VQIYRWNTRRNSLLSLAREVREIQSLSFIVPPSTSAHRKRWMEVYIHSFPIFLYGVHKKLDFKLSSCCVVCFLPSNSPAPEFYMPTFRNTSIFVVTYLWKWNSVPKRQNIKFRRRGRKHTRKNLLLPYSNCQNWYVLDCTASLPCTGIFVNSSITVVSSVGSVLLDYLFYSLPTGVYNRMSDIHYGQGAFVECVNKYNAYWKAWMRVNTLEPLPTYTENCTI
jgi:hypothetical protein